MKSLVCFLLLCACVQAEERLGIGSKAPPIDIEHWLNREPVKEWESGKVYVVEFWATWCYPCVASMPHLADYQRKYGEDLVVIGVSDESTGEIQEFLEKEKDGRTYKEITDAYWLATDPDKSVYRDYMTASDHRGIPTAFIIGKTGEIEWIGHPCNIKRPLALIIDDNWKRAEYTALEKKRPVDGPVALIHLSIGDRVSINVEGRTKGSVWGDKLYTLDSDPAAAAVHAGLLKEGEWGRIEFWIVPSPGSFEGVERNGIQSRDWGDYRAAYMMRLAKSFPHMNPSRGGSASDLKQNRGGTVHNLRLDVGNPMPLKLLEAE